MNYLKINNCPIYNNLNKRNKKFLYTYVFEANTQSKAYQIAYNLPEMTDSCYVCACNLLSKVKVKLAYDELVSVYSNITEEEIIQRIRDISINAQKDSDKLQALSLLGKNKAMFTSDQLTNVAIFNGIDKSKVLEGMKNRVIGKNSVDDVSIDSNEKKSNI